MTLRAGAEPSAATHLRDAMHHLANARRSLERARWQTNLGPDVRKLERMDVLVRQLGRAVARVGR